MNTKKRIAQDVFGSARFGEKKPESLGKIIRGLLLFLSQIDAWQSRIFVAFLCGMP